MNQNVRSLAVYDNSVVVFPGLIPGEKLELTWTGVMSTWTDSTAMPSTRPWVNQDGTFNRHVEEFIELGLQWRIAQFDDKDPALAGSMKFLYDKKLQEIIALGVQSERVNYEQMGSVSCP